MKTKRKKWSEMNLEELADATKEFDNPHYDPPAQKPTKVELAQLRRVQRKAAAARFRVPVALEQELIERTDEYAVNHGITFSDVVADALRRVVGKKSA